MHADQPATLAPGDADRLHRQLHADAGRPRRRQVDEHRDGRQRPDGADATPTTTVPLPQAPALTLVKRACSTRRWSRRPTGPTRATGSTYTLTATNDGNVTLTGVTIADPKLGTLVCTPPQPATLAPGAHDRLHRQLHADAGRPRTPAGREHGDGRQRPDAADGRDDETVPLPQAPALTLTRRARST